MATSNGRDKVCSLIQYNFQLYNETMSASEIVQFRAHWSVNAARRVQINVSSSRKMLKFLKFIDPLKKLYKFLTEKKHKSKWTKLLVVCNYVCACLLYLADNLVWLSTFGIVRKDVGQQMQWIHYKDVFALLKNVLSSFR